MGIRLLEKFAAAVAEVGVIESSPRIDGRNMVMVVGPLKNKAEAKAEARRLEQRENDKAKAADSKNRIDTSEPQGDLGGSVGRCHAKSDIMEKLAKVRAEAAAEEAAAVERGARKVAPVQRPLRSPSSKAPAKAAPGHVTPLVRQRQRPRFVRPPAGSEAGSKQHRPRSLSLAKPVAAPKPVAMPKPVAAPKPAGKPGPKAATRAAKHRDDQVRSLRAGHARKSKHENNGFPQTRECARSPARKDPGSK